MGRIPAMAEVSKSACGAADQRSPDSRRSVRPPSFFTNLSPFFSTAHNLSRRELLRRGSEAGGRRGFGRGVGHGTDTNSRVLLKVKYLSNLSEYDPWLSISCTSMPCVSCGPNTTRRITDSALARAWSTESKIDTMADVAKAGRWRRVRGRGRGVTTS